MLTEHEIEIRVRYPECDPMGFLHHSRVFVYFEMGRTELLRASGGSYRQMEEEGLLVVVVRAECRYLKPARYDDVLRQKTIVKRVTAAKIEHEYLIYRGDELLYQGHVVMAIVDRQGNLRRIPDWMQLDRRS
ncbi:MAG: acyl-CoA thioesterase [Planctomycetota bacterium]|nr:MAG: acyl-CoA thioesterase [Planctomycetota bacterium]